MDDKRQTEETFTILIKDLERLLEKQKDNCKILQE